MNKILELRSKRNTLWEQTKAFLEEHRGENGLVDYWELYGYLCINKKLADKYGIRCWTNLESFDRDMPIRFLPIKWEKMLYKLEQARKAGMEDVITFEFSHFMSPNSAYIQAGHLYDRYCDHFGIKNKHRSKLPCER